MQTDLATTILGASVSSSYYLRAIALTVLSFASGMVIIGLSQGFVIGFAVSSDSASDTNTAATIGGIAMLIGSVVAIGGLVLAINHYQTGARLQETEIKPATHTAGRAAARTSDPTSPADRFLQNKPAVTQVAAVPQKDGPGWYCETCGRYTDLPVTSHPGHSFTRQEGFQES